MTARRVGFNLDAYSSGEERQFRRDETIVWFRLLEQRGGRDGVATVYEVGEYGSDREPLWLHRMTSRIIEHRARSEKALAWATMVADTRCSR